jgi:hypothetical protein
MPEVDQAAAPQSIESRLSGTLFAEMQEKEAAPEEAKPDQVDEDAGEESAHEPEPTIDEVEVEVEGWKGKIPTKLKAEIDKGADYTRKTQTLADEKRLFDTQMRVAHEHQQFVQDASAELDQFKAIEAQLDQYKKVDLSQIDGETLSRMSMAAANLREERARLKETLDEKRNKYRTTMMSNWDEMTNKAKDVIVKSIPNWDSVAGQVAQYALNEGFPFEHITGHDRQTRERVGPGVVDPVFARTLYKAMQWDKLQASKATTTTKVANAPPVPKPGAPTNVQGAQKQNELKQQHKQKGSVDSAAALLRRYFKE